MNSSNVPGPPSSSLTPTKPRAKRRIGWRNELLPSLIRATWLRVVIAGQRVPEFAGAVWASVACAPLQLVPPPPADWFEYGKQHRPDLTLADVEVLSSRY